MNVLRYRAEDERATDRLAAALAATAPPRAVVSLRGPLGAGKTRLVRGVAAAAGVDPLSVVSPTFVLCQSYRGAIDLHHFDAYRLADEDEFLELGADETMESDGLTFVEWGERVHRCLPLDRVDIEIQLTDETCRQFVLSAGGPQARQWLTRVMSKLTEIK